jgi:hypothetical protein
MMQRLREQTSSPDPLTARAAALLSAMPPLDVDHLRRRPPVAARAAKAPVVGRVRTMLVLAISLGSVAAAAATVHHYVDWSGGFRMAVRSPALSPPSQVIISAGRGVTSDRGSAVAEAPLIAPVATQHVEQAAALQTSAAEVRTATAARIAAVSPGAPSPQSIRSHATSDGTSPASQGRGQPATRQSRETTGTDESALIVDAVRALRRDGDAVRAQALAEEALQRYQHGAQVEEAMALSMEAASARGDTAGARRAAQRYLESYPAGRFADRALRAASPPPK